MKKKSAYFEKLDVWKRSCQLAVNIYKTLSDCKDFGLRDQIQRAVVSIPSNIAEGAERNSNAEYIKFLYYSKGSAAELRTQLYIARKINIIPTGKSKQYIQEAKNISGMLQNLIARIKKDAQRHKGLKA
ncbi:MAG: four helix bundle protein [Candidatus Marinimicrobia bacterium]|nr:four helix bundle protein [Candidatus Neomarinimicrobiota bacterium]